MYEHMKNFNRLEIVKKIRLTSRDLCPEALGLMHLYAPYHEYQPYNGIHVERDICYGTDTRNRLDIFTSNNYHEGDNRDILVFLHGGGFVRGDKKLEDSPYHDNIALWAVRNGMVGVNMNYRFAPQHKYPSGIEDLTIALEWLKNNIYARGGDINRLFLFGSSAGAVHIACYITKSSIAGYTPVAGAILQSGGYDFTKFAGSDYLKDIMLNLSDISPQKKLIEIQLPVFYVFCECVIPMIEREHLSFINDYAGYWNKAPNFFRLMGHNHFTAVASLNSPDNSFSSVILDFIDRSRQRYKS